MKLATVLSVVVVLGTGVVAAIGQVGAPSQRTSLEDAQALWKRQDLRDYRFRLRVRCFCPQSGRPATITVRNGRPHGATQFQKTLDTVPELFATVRKALDDPKAGQVTVRYDARRGFPRTASVDRIKNAIDDEIGWTVDRFRALRARR